MKIVHCPRASMRSFRSAESGSVAIIFAVALFPLIGLLGAGVDFSYASMVRSSLRSSIDATGLMLSKTAASQNAAQLQASAEAYFRANFHYPDVTPPTIVATYSNTPIPTVSITGTTSVNPFFMGIMGVDKIDVSANTEVKWGNTKLRVAMALDVTKSMETAGKIGAMKTAAKSFLTQMQAAAVNNGDVYVSIIPFNKDVNVGVANFAQTWVKWTQWDEVNGTCSRDNDRNNTRTKCLNAGRTWTPRNHNTWNGCVMDRDMAGGDHDTKNTAPTTATPATLFWAEQYNDPNYGGCPAELMALSYNWTTLKAKIDALQPVGTTNQGIGLAWAYQSLTAAPFTIPAKDPNFNYKQVIILMSDGLNTQSRHYPVLAAPASTAGINARQKILCDNVKAAGIVIYTVHVNTDGDPMSTLLQECASDPGKFFHMTSASAMVATFERIATELKDVYIAY